MADFSINSLLGGQNDTDPKIALPDDQCVLARNVEFVNSMLGDRRRGTSAITLPSSLSGQDRITFLHEHVPGTDFTASELWALGVTGTSTYQLARKTTSWSDATITADTPLLTGFAPYQWQAVSLHGKLFIAFDSDVNRLHVVTAGSTTVRRTGLAAPAAAPTATDSGSGTFSGTRYYRVREAELSGSTVLRRGEPSAVLTKAPSGSGTGFTVTKPTDTSEGATHWELEASLDNANFYRIARTVVGTTTYDDTTDVVAGYAQTFPLSEDIEDYTLLPSARYLVADEDRLVYGGCYEDTSRSSEVGWTPVNNADGVGNDERIELDTDPSVNLDGLEGGPLTGLASASMGEIFAFKFGRVYKLVRQGVRAHAYDPICLTKAIGALHGSVVVGLDQMGRPCVYFLDPSVGPYRAGVGGLKRCGMDLFTTWETLNIDATKVVCSGVYYPATQQVIWNIAVSGSNTPNLSLVLHTTNSRETEDGVRKGYATWDGTRSKGLTMCLFASNIEAGTARSLTRVPFIGTEGLGLAHRCDTGSDDNGTAYAARIVTKPYTLKSILYRFGVAAGALLAKAVAGSKITVKVVRDFGLETPCTVDSVSLAATASETDVIKVLDNLVGSEMSVAQFELLDPTSAGTRFELNQLTLSESAQGGNGTGR